MKSIRIMDRCICCYKMGAVGKGHSFVTIRGACYALCYRHAQVLCDVGRPEKDEEYPMIDESALGVTGTMPRAGKRMPTMGRITIEGEEVSNNEDLKTRVQNDTM